MARRSSLGAAVLVAAGILAAAGSPALAGAGHGGAMFHAGVGVSGGRFHGAGISFHGQGSSTRMPPVSGVIHERPGMRPYVSAFGHTNTAVPLVAFDRSSGIRPDFTGHGHTDTEFTSGGYGRRSLMGHGQVVTVSAPGAYRRSVGSAHGYTGTMFRPGIIAAGRGADREARRHGFRERLARDGSRRRLQYGRLAEGYGGYGGYAEAGGTETSGDEGTYDTPGTYGVPGTYGGQGTFGGFGTSGRPGIYGIPRTYGSGGFSYVSEAPLAARFAEPPLAPSPGEGANSYAYAASEDVGRGTHAGIVWVNRSGGSNCGCGPRVHAAPAVYRYGVGTAY